jgi:hypothetical protein
VVEQIPAAVPSKGCYNFSNNLYFGVHRWEGYSALVTKLQNTLKTNENAVISDRAGVFGTSTAQAVANFQEKYRSETLTPQGLTNGTGVFDKLTQKALNQKYGCVTRPSVSIIAPVGKVTYSLGDKVRIQWNATLIPRTTDLKISYVKVSTRATTTIATVPNIRNGLGTYEWTIPTTLEKGDYLLLVELTGSVSSAQSVQAFSIQEKMAVITYPIGGGEFVVEKPEQIKWSTSRLASSTAYAVIKLKPVPTASCLIATPASCGDIVVGRVPLRTGSISYTPASTSVGIVYNVSIEVYARVADIGDASKIISQDISDPIIITARALQLVRPTQSDLTRVKPGDSINVGWRFVGNASNVNVLLAKGGNATTTLLANVFGGNLADKNATVRIPVSQAIGSDYKLFIVSVDGKFSASSTAFSIVSGSAGITVLRPVAGTYKLGESVNIEWSSSNLSGLKVALYKGDTLIKDAICAIANVAVTSCSYRIPTNNASFVEADDYNIRVYSTVNSSIKGQSANFRIERGAGITLNFPATVNKGENLDILWDLTGTAATIPNVKIELWQAGALKGTLASSVVASTKRFSWLVPATATIYPAGNYLIKVISTTNTSISAERELTINAQGITVTAPTAGTVNLGSTLNIAWTNTGAVANVKIELVNQATNAVTVIAASHPNTVKTKAYVIPRTLAPGNYKVRITDLNNSATRGESVQFAVGTAMSITMEPLSRNAYTRGQSIDIGWVANNVSALKIELLKGGVLSNVIATSLSTSANGGHYSYTIPTTLATSTAYSIKITSINPNNPAIKSESPVFSILSVLP